MKISISPLVSFSLLVLLATQISGCTKNPTTGKDIFTGGLSETEEIRIGKTNHSKVVADFGGEYGSADLKKYINSIGQLLARTTERANLKWRFTILNTNIVNAFAMPGGYVYITRGLLALADNEAQIASVLAHEIAHVTALHHARRYGRTWIANVGVLTARLLAGREAARITEFGTTSLLQSFSRDNEYESDRLGMRYIVRAGYEPNAMPKFLSKLRADAKLTAKRRGEPPDSVDQFNYLATHPAPLARINRASSLAASARTKRPMTARHLYLSKINGILYGDDPEQGIIRHREFVHPRLLIKFSVPAGYSMFNTKRAVYAFGPSKCRIIFDAARQNYAHSMRSYIIKIWARRVQLKNVETIKVNGLEAATANTRLNTLNGTVDVRFVAYRVTSGKIYRFLFITPPNQTSKQSFNLRKTTYSFRELALSEAKNVRPLKLRIYTTRDGDNVKNLVRRMPYTDYVLERFEVLNGITHTKKLRVGQKIKMITLE